MMNLLNVIADSGVPSVQEKMQEMYSDRVDETTFMVTHNDPIFKKLSDESEEAGKVIREALPSGESFKLFDAFDVARISEETYMFDKIYEQAFKDGMEFMQGFMFETAGKNTPVRSAAGGIR